MQELSEYIYSLLNVSAVTNIATGGVWALLADQEVETFVTYSFGFDASESKDQRNRHQVNISCYASRYKIALQMHDAVETVLKSAGAYLDALDSEYIYENKEAVVSSRFTLKRTINN